MDDSKLARWPKHWSHTEILLKLYQSGERDFRDLIFHKLQLAGAVLRGADFSGCVLIECSFQGADLHEANFTGAQVSGTRLSKARLEHACFHGAEVLHSWLNEASLKRADFTRAIFTGAHLERADLTDARFVHADLADTVHFEGAQLTGACFDGANLIAFSFPEGTWPRMSFRGVLHGSRMDHSKPDRRGPALQLPPGYTHEAEGTHLVGPGAALAGLDLQGFRFGLLDLTGADFTGADLRQARFGSVVLKNTCFRNANLEGTSFLQLHALIGCDFTGAHGNIRDGELELLADCDSRYNSPGVCRPSPALAELVGSRFLELQDAVRKVEAYAMAHKLSAGRGYRSDEKLRSVLGQEQFTVSELGKLLQPHLTLLRPRKPLGIIYPVREPKLPKDEPRSVGSGAVKPRARKKVAPEPRAKAPAPTPAQEAGARNTELLLKLYQSGERHFHKLHLDGLQLAGATLPGASFTDCVLSGSFEGADLREAHFTGTTFDHADLSKARLERARFQGATLSQSTLDGASLQEADFTRASLSEVYLKQADLTNARFVHANLTGDVYLKGATLTGAVFDEANLISLVFPAGTWPHMSFRGALHGAGRHGTGEGLKLPPGYTHEAEGTRLVGPGVVLAGLDLQGFRFRGLDLSGADFTGANLREALFADVLLKGARFKGVNLEGAGFYDLPDGALDGADFSGASGKPRTQQLAHLMEGNTSPSGMKLFFPSPALAEIVGSTGLSRTDAMKRVHAYVNEHKLSAGKLITTDEKLKRVTGKEQLTVFELTRFVNQHLHDTRAEANSAGSGEGAAE